MQSGSYLGVLRRWWFTLVAATVVGALAGWLVAGILPVSHRSETRLLVGPVNADFDTIRAAAELTRTYADLATSSDILSSAIESGGLPLSVDALREAVRAIPNERTRIITISTELPSADEAVRAADATSQALIAYAAAGAQRPEGELRIVDGATAAISATPGRTALAVVLAAVGALLGALLLVILIEWLDSTLRDAGQVRRLAGRAFAGEIPISRQRDAQSTLNHGADPHYLGLLGDLHGSDRRAVHSILVLSADGPFDAADAAQRIAAAAASLGIGASLIEAGSGPITGDVADAAAAAGLVDGGVIDSDAAVAIRDEILRSADMLIVVGGSALGNYAAPIWARAVDRVLLVVRLGRAKRDPMRQAIDRLDAVPGARTSVVAASVRGRRRRGSTVNAALDEPALERTDGPEAASVREPLASIETLPDEASAVRRGANPRAGRAGRRRRHLGRQAP